MVKIKKAFNFNITILLLNISFLFTGIPYVYPSGGSLRVPMQRDTSGRMTTIYEEESPGQEEGAGIELESKFYLCVSLEGFKAIRDAFIEAYNVREDIIYGLRFSVGPRNKVLAIGNDEDLGKERPYVFFDRNGSLENLGIRFGVRDRERNYQTTVKIPVSIFNRNDTSGAVIELNATLTREPNGIKGLKEITPNEAIEAILSSSGKVSGLPKGATVRSLVEQFLSSLRDLSAQEATALSYKVETNHIYLETDEGAVDVAIDRVTVDDNMKAAEFYEIEIEAKDTGASDEKNQATIERARVLLSSWLKDRFGIELELQPKGASKFQRARQEKRALDSIGKDSLLSEEALDNEETKASL